MWEQDKHCKKSDKKSEFQKEPIMNILTMNKNLQSQQSRNRQQESGKKRKSNVPPKSEKASACDSSMLLQRKENQAIPLSIDENRKCAPNQFSSRNPKMGEPHKREHDGDFHQPSPSAENDMTTTPHPNDVLCGRGGSINAHSGNIVFRGWIQERRESYNLAETKSAKTRITNDIFLRIKSLIPPGRFLHKIDTTVASGEIDEYVDWWTEVNDTKALAKISQALREGAPAFRAAHGKPRKSQRSSHRRRNSVPMAKTTQYEIKTRSSKHHKTSESPNVEAAYNRAAGINISSSTAGADTSLDVGNYDSLFNHNQMQSYKNIPFSNTRYQRPEYEHYVGITTEGNNNRFDQSRPLNSHPLVNMRDYNASLSDVANAIPPTPPTYQKPRATSYTTPESLPNIYTQAPVSPYAMQYEQFDPFAFLSPVSSGDQYSSSRIQQVASSNPSVFKRENSLSFSESELQDDIGEFSNPFEGDEVINKTEKSNSNDDTKERAKTIQMREVPFTMPNHTSPSPHVIPPARCLSFEGIGDIPSGHFLGDRKSSASSNHQQKLHTQVPKQMT